uniref:Uncharacterized protein n=1 Tax=Klebsiella pneumoniae TaxID=573 RepID=A0A0G2ST51_KLEPN|nr:hypothetical protein [Klebsiella pneumoniae]
MASETSFCGVCPILHRSEQEPTVGHRANVAEWRQRRHFAAFALSCIAVKRTRLVRYD